MCLCVVQIKCQQYWPSAGEATYGSYVVKVLETSTFAQYTVRTIEYHPVSVRLVAQTSVYTYTDSWATASTYLTLLSVYVCYVRILYNLGWRNGQTRELTLFALWWGVQCFFLPPHLRQVDEPGNAKTVRQFHFTAWPDFGVPLNGGPLLKFLVQVRKHHNYTNAKPLLVHCRCACVSVCTRACVCVRAYMDL